MHGMLFIAIAIAILVFVIYYGAKGEGMAADEFLERFIPYIVIVVLISFIIAGVFK